MAQMIMSWSIYDGAIRVDTINAVGRRKGRIIEVEVVDTHERFHGSAQRLERLVQTLLQSRGELDQAPSWTPGRTLANSDEVLFRRWLTVLTKKRAAAGPTKGDAPFEGRGRPKKR